MSFFTINQLAAQWKLHPITIRRYIREGKLKATKIGGRVRIEKSAAENMAKALRPMRRRKPTHLTSQPAHRAFSESDPLWRLKGVGSSQVA